MRRNFLKIFIKFVCLGGAIIFISVSPPLWAKTSPENYQKEIADLREELDVLKNQVNRLQSYVQEKDQKVVSLTKQLVDFALRLSEKEILLSQKIDDLDSLNERVIDLHSRLELGERLIEEKDKKVSSLEHFLQTASSQVVKQKAHIQEATIVKDQQMRQLNGFLAIYKDKLKWTQNLLVGKNNHAEALRQQMAVLQKEQQLGKTMIRNKNQEIDSLKRTVDRLRLRN